jgi:hypothetical protein
VKVSCAGRDAAKSGRFPTRGAPPGKGTGAATVGTVTLSPMNALTVDGGTITRP